MAQLRGPLAALLGAVLLATTGPLPASGAPPSGPVSAVPAANTPAILDGQVYDAVQIGSTMLVAGSFTQARSAGSTEVLTRSRLLAFDVATGVLSPSFAPVFSDYVETLLPGPTPGTVYVGGKFNTVDGYQQKGLVLLDVATGARVTGFAPPYLNGIVQDLVLRQGQLLVGGTFTTYGGQPRGGLASVDPSTGALTGYLTVGVAGNHNYNGSGAKGAVGVTRFDMTPDETRLVMIGNFRTVAGVTRRQIAMLNLNGSTATLRTDWRTNRLNSPCRRQSVDSWVRDVDLSPDGSYFVVVGKGGYFPGTLCDAAARFETGAVGQDVQPTWVSETGGDTFLSVAISGSSVYVGGHQRWVNNPLVRDAAGPGAVPRAGVVALEPDSGMPQSWNPGRNPRGAGADMLYLTDTGLWMGSDTEYIGYFAYSRPRLAFFPFPGTALPDRTAPVLPGTVYLAGPTSGSLGGGSSFGGDDLARRSFDGTTAGAVAGVDAQGVAWSQLRGGFVLGSTFYSGGADGMLYRRSFDGTTFGAATAIDPYNDPAWVNAKTGKAGGQTYRGLASDFYAELPSVTGLAGTSARLYYTLAGDANLYWRWWSPDSGTVHPVRNTVAGGQVGSAQGMFLSGGQLYVVSAADGSLTRWGLSGTALTGPAVPVSGPAIDGTDWRARGVFVAPPG